jgi:hypothetical protein
MRCSYEYQLVNLLGFDMQVQHLLPDHIYGMLRKGGGPVGQVIAGLQTEVLETTKGVFSDTMFLASGLQIVRAAPRGRRECEEERQRRTSERRTSEWRQRHQRPTLTTDSNELLLVRTLRSRGTPTISLSCARFTRVLSLRSPPSSHPTPSDEPAQDGHRGRHHAEREEAQGGGG